MAFFDSLVSHTQDARSQLVAAPIVQACLRGQVGHDSYVAFLREAYHHVSHTVPLLREFRARVPQGETWLADALDEYIEEEDGHDQWILNDLSACGEDADAARDAGPGPACEIMVAYAYDTIQRGNPMGLFGMVHVLEGTSVALALTAADQIQRTLALPDNAFSYMRSHGTLDQAHTAHFAMLMDDIDKPADQHAITHAARMFYRLYGDIFRALPMPITTQGVAS